MKKYNTFINENLVEYLKKGFAQSISMLSNDKQNNIVAFIESVNKTNNFEDGLKLSKKIFENNIVKKVENITNFNSILKDDLITIDVVLKTLHKKYSASSLLPKTFYSKSNNKILKDTFSYDNEVDFLKNLKFNMKQIMYQILSGSGMEKVDIKSELEKLSESILFELQEVKKLKNTDGLDDLQDQEIEDQVEEEEGEQDNDNNFSEISKKYIEFQKNVIYLPLIKQLELIKKKIKNEFNNPKDL